MVLIAPPVTTSSFEVLRTSTVPKLVVQGTADEVCPLDALDREWPTWAEPKRLVTVEGAGHFFDRKLAELESALAGELSAEAAGGA